MTDHPVFSALAAETRAASGVDIDLLLTTRPPQVGELLKAVPAKRRRGRKGKR
jgi:hypothetical protein